MRAHARVHCLCVCVCVRMFVCVSFGCIVVRPNDNGSIWVPIVFCARLLINVLLPFNKWRFNETCRLFGHLFLPPWVFLRVSVCVCAFLCNLVSASTLKPPFVWAPYLPVWVFI